MRGEYKVSGKRNFFIWRVSRSWQHSRRYITAEDKNVKDQTKGRTLPKTRKRVEELKVGDSEKRKGRYSRGGIDVKEG